MTESRELLCFSVVANVAAEVFGHGGASAGTRHFSAGTKVSAKGLNGEMVAKISGSWGGAWVLAPHPDRHAVGPVGELASRASTALP